MDNLKYSKEEIKCFEETLSTILDDLENLWKIGALKKISINMAFPELTDCFEDIKSNYWSFNMDEEGFYFKEKSGIKKCIFADRLRNGELIKYLEINEQDIVFINKYQNIRKSIVSKIKKAQRKKNVHIQKAKSIAELYKKDATIEIELPESLNKHQIEVQEEDGRKIGTLNFGSLSIKIITTGDIELVHKDKGKVKQK